MTPTSNLSGPASPFAGEQQFQGLVHVQACVSGGGHSAECFPLMGLWFAFLGVALLLLTGGCGRDADAQARNELVGTWVLRGNYEGGIPFISTITVGNTGNYSCRIVTYSESGSERVVDLGGIFQIEHGFLVDTMTTNSNTSAGLPTTTRAQIVRMDKHEMTLRWEKKKGVVYPSEEEVFRKVAQ